MLNILDVTLLSLTISFVLVGSLITNYEMHMPVTLIKLFRYGCFGYKGAIGGRFLETIELPKSYYRHFYLFAAVLSSVTLIYLYLLYFLSFQINRHVQAILEGIFKVKEPKVSALGAAIALSLVALHCARRCYESHLLQVFARSGKINLCHYLTAYVHYTFVILATVGEAPLFCGEQNRETMWRGDWNDMLYLPCVILFILASHEQYRSNLILANLRKDKKTGAVISEEHRIPRGRMFERISSPHRFWEIVLYIVLAILIPTRTMLIMCLWVVCNQIQCAVHAQEWYKKTFKDYPENRNAILPFLL